MIQIEKKLFKSNGVLIINKNLLYCIIVHYIRQWKNEKRINNDINLGLVSGQANPQGSIIVLYFKLYWQNTENTEKGNTKILIFHWPESWSREQQWEATPTKIWESNTK